MYGRFKQKQHPRPEKHVWGHTAISDLADHQIPRRLRARAMVVHYLAKDGRRRVKGGSDLKRSQAYPAQTLHWNLLPILGVGLAYCCFYINEFFIKRDHGRKIPCLFSFGQGLGLLWVLSEHGMLPGLPNTLFGFCVLRGLLKTSWMKVIGLTSFGLMLQTWSLSLHTFPSSHVKLCCFSCLRHESLQFEIWHCVKSTLCHSTVQIDVFLCVNWPLQTLSRGYTVKTGLWVVCLQKA